MVYETFLTTVKEALHNRLGSQYNISIQQVPKNNGTMLDGLCISRHSDRITPTIYLNAYYHQLEEGVPLDSILDEIFRVYTDNSVVPQVDPSFLSDFPSLRPKVAYKLIHRESNQKLLTTIPHMDYLDLSIVFYLFLEENEYGHMTALIYQNHMESWGTTMEELYQLASVNTPRLLHADVKSMDDVMKELAQAKLGDDYDEAFIDELLDPSDTPPLFVLSNSAGLNGACAILYENLLKNFADSLEQDLVILPSSIHEVLLIPYTEDICFEELLEMVHHINLTEVPVEDRLSNQIYYFDRIQNQVTLIPTSPEDQAS